MPALPPHFHLLHLHLGQDHGGAETFFVKLARGLGARGIRQSAIVPRNRIWIPAVEQSDCSVTQMDFRKGISGLLDNIRLKKQIHHLRPSLIMVWMDRAARRVPKGPWPIVGRLGGYYHLKHYKNCDVLVGNTPGLVDYMIQNGRPATQVRMISNFPDMTPTGRPIDRAAHNTPADVPLLVALGRLDPMKGFDTLLDALPQIPTAHLWLLGEGPERANLSAQIDRLGLGDRVHLLGWIPAPAPYIEAADIFVCPSRHEPLGNVILESWALHRPVVACDSEGPSWLITPDHNGLLCPKDNPNTLASAINRLITNPTLGTQLVAGGQQRLDQEFSEDRICEAYIDLFQSCLAERARIHAHP